MAKQPEIKEELGDKSSVTEVSKKSAEMWRNLPAEERAHWDDVAAKDKQRYMVEKSSYTGPWQVPWKRAKKDPSAPKRPMSAFLYFSQDKRRQIKDANPTIRNTEVSRILGELWRNASEEEKSPHVEREKSEREKYKVAIAEWRTEYELKVEEQRKVQAEQAAYMSNMFQNSEQGPEGQSSQYQQQYPHNPYGEHHGGAYSHYMHGSNPMYAYPPQYPAQMYRKSSSRGDNYQQYHLLTITSAPQYPPAQGQYGYANGKHVAVLGPNGMPHYQPPPYSVPPPAPSGYESQPPPQYDHDEAPLPPGDHEQRHHQSPP